MERFILGFSAFFAFALGMFFDGGQSPSQTTSSVTQYGKATLETDG